MKSAVVTPIYPPIPVRNFDYVAVHRDYEPGEPMGFGATECDAIADLHANSDLGVLDDEDSVPASPFCGCALVPMFSERDSGCCAACGKALP